MKSQFQLLWQDLVSFISVRSDSTVVEVLLSWFTACLIISFVMSSLGSTGTSSFAFSIDFLSFGSAEVVLLTFAPVLIMVDKGIQGHFTDTVHMPVCRCKINPFLAAVTACRTVKVSIHTRIGLIKDADKIIAMDNSLLAVRDINHQYIVVATCKEKAVCAICGIHYG